MTEYNIPLRLNSLTNQRGHWGKRHRTAKAHRNAMIVIKKHKVPCVVEIVRVGKGTLDDDNLRAAGKSVRDGIADRLGVNDNDPRVTWKYGQQTGEYSVIVRITEADNDS